jgi:hypothetical protein
MGQYQKAVYFTDRMGLKSCVSHTHTHTHTHTYIYIYNCFKNELIQSTKAY